MHTLVMILQGLFIVGAVGCCITIPLAAWGYFSVLFDKDTEEEERDSANPNVAADCVFNFKAVPQARLLYTGSNGAPIPGARHPIRSWHKAIISSSDTVCPTGMWSA